MRRQPGGESGQHTVWNRRTEQLARRERDWAALRLTRCAQRHGLGNGGCCEEGEPAEASFDATARDDQHEHSDRSLRETDRGGCRVASGPHPHWNAKVGLRTRSTSMKHRNGRNSHSYGSIDVDSWRSATDHMPHTQRSHRLSIAGARFSPLSCRHHLL
jgi:hypothetical protein